MFQLGKLMEQARDNGGRIEVNLPDGTAVEATIIDHRMTPDPED